MALSLGFGMKISQNILFDYSKNPLQSLDEARVEELLCWHVARELADSFHITGEGPREHYLGELVELQKMTRRNLQGKLF